VIVIGLRRPWPRLVVERAGDVPEIAAALRRFEPAEAVAGAQSSSIATRAAWTSGLDADG
jgi:hypothetical protein